MLYATCGAEKKYYPANEVYYQSKRRLPQQILADKPILKFPLERSAEKVSDVFRVNDLSNIQCNVESFTLNKTETHKLAEKINERQLILLAYRIQHMDKRNEKTEATNKVKSFNINLCSYIEYSFEQQLITAANYEYFLKDKEYYIKIPEQTLNVERLRDKAIQPILETHFEINDVIKLRDIILSNQSITDLSQDAEDYLGSSVIDEAKTLLNIQEKTINIVEAIHNEEYDETPDEITNDGFTTNEIAEEQQTATEVTITTHTPQSHSSFARGHYPNTSRNGARTFYDDISPAPNQLGNNTQKTISLIKIENSQNETQNNSSTNANDSSQDKKTVTESEEHKQLIQEIKNKPSLIATNAEYYRHEQAISSPVITDIPDIILGDNDNIYIVEVKVYQTNNVNNENNELRRGIFQCLRYRLAYEKLIEYGKELDLPKYQELFKPNGTPKAIIPVLAYNTEFPDAIKEVAKAENIKFETVSDGL